MNFKNSWWKYLSLLLILFSMIGGLYTPLKTSISGASPFVLKAGQTNKLQLFIYNGGSGNVKLNSILLKKDAIRIKSNSIIKTTSEMAEVSINIPANIGKDSLLMDCYADIKGVWSQLPNAILVVGNNLDSTLKIEHTALNTKDNIKEKSSFGSLPYLMVLYETIRNLVFHVPLWFSMIALLSVSFYYSIKYLNKPNLELDTKIYSLVHVSILNGVLGCVTGATWARATWGDWWPAQDPKLQGVAVGMFLYLAYLLLRSSIEDPHQKAKVSAVYNIFIYPIFIALIAVMPKLVNVSLHPGTGGSVGFNNYDLNNTLRMFFYPAVIGWIMLFAWIAQLKYKIEWKKRAEELK